MVKYLQEELIAVRLREAETACTIKELKLKISDLEDVRNIFLMGSKGFCFVILDY